jgi:hypothetical protein
MGWKENGWLSMEGEWVVEYGRRMGDGIWKENARLDMEGK